MCRECLVRIFELSLKDPACMPPKCCTDDHIPLSHVDKLFDIPFKIRWNRRYEEWHTANRLYCPTAKCGEWIKPTRIVSEKGRKFARCPRCKTKVCPTCSSKSHKSTECPKDPEILKLIEQAKEKGWQRCYSCSALVELREGCNHMTCRCLAEFCMLCGGQWKTCDCPWFNHSRPPNQDRLNEMRIPAPARQTLEQLIAPPRPVEQANQSARPTRTPPQSTPAPEMTYQQELDARRRQERQDEDLAWRLQLAWLWEPDEAPARVARPVADTWGLGNAAGHDW